MMNKLAVLACASLFSGSVLAGTATPPLPEEPPPPEEPVELVDEKGKFLVCHKGRKTLAVGSQSSKDDHMNHGDTEGRCPEA